jgi:uncharacterized protein
MTSALWHSPRLNSAEYCQLSQHQGGHLLEGMLVVPIEGLPAHISYEIDVDNSWCTRRAEVSVTDPLSFRRIIVEADGKGRWSVDALPAPQLDGCLDIDLGWSPSTNTLPIRRLHPMIGESVSITAAWLRFPELQLEQSSQEYSHTAEKIWRYSSGNFSATLEVDDNGLVLDYENIWRAIAHHG